MAKRKLQLEARSLEPEWEELCDIEVKDSDQSHSLRINVHLPFEDLVTALQVLSPKHTEDWTYHEESQIVDWFLATAFHEEDIEFLRTLNPSYPQLFGIVVSGVLFLSQLGLVTDDDDATE